MSATAQRGRGGRGGSVVEYAGAGGAAGEYQLTELKNVSTSRSSSTNAADLNIRLVRAVRDHPCFYDSSDPHYGTSHRDARHRSTAWHQVVAGIGYSGDTNALLQQWRKLLSKYTKERREGVSGNEEPMDDELAAEMAWLDEYVLDALPASSSVPAPPPPSVVSSQQPQQQLFFMEGDEEEDLLGDDFVDQHDEEYQEEERLERGTSPAGSAHSGTGSDIDVGGSSSAAAASQHSLGGVPKSESALGGHGGGTGPRIITVQRGGGVPVTSGGTHTQQSYRYVTSSSSHQQPHHPPDAITVHSNRGNGTAAMIVHPKKEGSMGGSGGSTLTMVIDPTTYYQNGTQKMYRLVNVADLDQSAAHHPLHQHHHLRPGAASREGMTSGGSLLAEPLAGGSGMGVGRGTRKRMGAPLSPPSHAGGGMLGGPSSSSAVDHTSPYGKSVGQLGDDIILDDGIVGENTIVIDHQRDDDSPLLVDSPGMHHHHHMMMGGSGGGQRGMGHRGQHSPTLMGNGAGARGSGAYSPGLLNQGPSFTTSQYDADLALQHFISTHLARMNEDDKALAKMNIQRILLDARFGLGTTLKVCLNEEEMGAEAELADAAVASEMVTGD